MINVEEDFYLELSILQTKKTVQSKIGHGTMNISLFDRLEIVPIFMVPINPPFADNSRLLLYI